MLKETNIDGRNLEVFEFRTRMRNMYESGKELNNIGVNTTSFIEKPIRREDSLQSIAIRYGMKIADLKKANNLISDQDFFALNLIKIPIPKGSVREEMIQCETAELLTNSEESHMNNDHSQTHQSDDSDWESDLSINETETRHLLQRTDLRHSVQNVTTTVPRSIGNDFLKRIDESVQNATLSSSRQERRVEDVVSQLALNTADCSWVNVQHKNSSVLSWSHVIMAALCIAVVLPITVLLYWYFTHPGGTNYVATVALNSTVTVNP